MAVLNALIERSPEDVWAVLEDGHTYADWVVGTQEIHEVDEGWPAVGACIHYSVGIGPITFDDVTTVRRVVPPRELELEARAGWLGSARVSFDVRPWGKNTLVIIDEHPLSGPGKRWHNTVVEVLLRFRNRRMLRKLSDAVKERSRR
ncbi:MAG: SRPBCC family protein [Pseudonocardiaceae bacterium]